MQYPHSEQCGTAALAGALPSPHSGHVRQGPAASPESSYPQFEQAVWPYLHRVMIRVSSERESPKGMQIIGS
jgi:hypothetical protein